MSNSPHGELPKEPNPSMTKMVVGKSIAHYEVLDELGRGGMGIVYKARDPKLNRTVALKVLPSAMLTSQEDRSRFYREARAAAALSHPNIATVYAIDEAVPEGSGSDDVRPFIAMEFIDGPSLDSRIAEGPLPLIDAVNIATQIASALQVAHEKDIVHRDIKSANVMLTTKGEAKVLDFGLAKTAQSTKLTQMGSTLGTAAYMSPEQARGEEVDSRSDLWSLGAVLYEMISGRLPFHGEYEQAIVFGILNQDPEPLTAIRTGVPMALEQVVDKLLEKDRAFRYQGAADVIADLKRLAVDLAEDSASTRRTGLISGMTPDQRKPWRKIRPIQPLAAVGIFLIGALGAWFFVGSSAEPAETDPPLHLNLVLPDSAVYDDPQWSPDETKILFSADMGDRKGYIVEYDLKTGLLTDLTDADLNLWPHYSPDGRSIFFTSLGGMLMRQTINGRQPSPVTQATRKDGLGWISSNEIIFVRSGALLVRNLKTGAEDTLNSEIDTRWFHDPAITADSSILFAGTYSGTRAIDLSTRELIPALEIRGDYFLDVTHNNFVLFAPDVHESHVWARRFDPNSRTYLGPEFLALDPEGERMAVSRSGHLIYEPRANPDAPWLLEPIYEYRNRERVSLVAHSGMFTEGDTHEFRITPDGRYLAMQILQGGIVRFERSSHTTVRLVDSSVSAWPCQFSYDGRWLYFYAKVEDGSWNVLRVDSEGRNAPEKVVGGQGLAAIYPSISRDGETLVFVRENEDTGWDIWGKNLSSGEEYPIVVAQHRQSSPSISPGGRFVAFGSRDARDQESVVVRDLATGESVALAEGVGKPRWDRDGGYLYYESRLIGEIYRVPFSYSDGMNFGRRETMYSDPRSDHTHWDIPPEDDVILVGQPEGMIKGGVRWRVVLNWAQTLEEQ